MIERLEVNDAGRPASCESRPTKKRPPAETVTRAIEIGSRLIESEGTAANVDYVRAELERQTAAASPTRLGGVIEEGQEEFAERLAEQLRQRAERLGAAADPRDADHGDGASANPLAKQFSAAGRSQSALPTSRRRVVRA